MARKQVVTTGITARKRANSPHQPTGTWIRPEKRLAINLRDHFTCLVCARDLSDADPRDVTLDHVTPKVDGGSNHESNLATLCRHCNCSRQDKPMDRFASPEAIQHIRRNVKRCLKPYIKLAKAYLNNEVGREDLLRTAD
jgi:5-methylcytosine-specific restriction endonuclease McrA